MFYRLTILLLLVSSTAWAAAPAVVHLESQTACLSGQGIAARLEALVDKHGARKHLSVIVSDAPATAGRLARLRVVGNRTGEVLLEREFALQVEDCPSAGDLLVVVLEEFFESFPLQEWVGSTEPPRPETIFVTRDLAELAGQAFLALDSRWPEPGADIELGLALDMGSSRHRLVGSAALRLCAAHDLGGGSYIESLVLLGVGWRSVFGKWMLRAEARSGALLISGFGYPKNYQRWMLWAEAQLGVLWAWKGVLLGPQIAVSPLWHQVETTAGAKRTLPWLRVGLVLAWPFWSEKF